MFPYGSFVNLRYDAKSDDRRSRRTVHSMQFKMTRVGSARCRPWPSARMGLGASVLLMATVCIGAFALDRDRGIAQFYYTFWSEKDGAPSEISSLAQTQDGYLWIGSERGLFRFDGVNFEEYSPPPGVNLPSHSIYSLMATPDGGLWIAFEPNGVGFYKDGSLTVFTRPEQHAGFPRPLLRARSLTEESGRVRKRGWCSARTIGGYRQARNGISLRR